MAKLFEEAQDYEPKQIKSIADFESVKIDVEVLEDLEAEYPYKYIEVKGERHKVPVTVLASLKELLKENPELKEFKVNKTGEGLKTKYTVIPLSTP